MTPVLELAQELFDKLRDADRSTANHALRIAGELLSHRESIVIDMRLEADREEADRIRASLESDAAR